MGKKGKKELVGTYIFSDEVMDEMQNLEATAALAVLDDFPQDDAAATVPGETRRRTVTDADSS